MAEIINGKVLAKRIKCNVTQELAELEIKPYFAIIQVGNSPASNRYVNNKIKDCKECGIDYHWYEWDSLIDQHSLEDFISKLSEDETVHAIMLQLPVPKHLNVQKLINKIAPEKDVDGLTALNSGKLIAGLDGFVPCTAAGCMEMIHSTGIDIAGKNAVIIGRSNIVGKPIAMQLLKENATITICHSHTIGLKEICQKADILIAAVGKKNFITVDMIKPGAVVIDVGINVQENGKLCGDVDFERVKEIAGYITPVPGGVGLMTRAMLMRNIMIAAENQVPDNLILQ
jgi:methylenetetrahydrofolate dehydrogenase (NADP+)/methenyltetrahydrofolate cyclohydrolase